MRPYLVIGALCLAALSGPALAQEACTRPEAPKIDSKAAAASMEALTAAREQTQAFIKASDDYQTCVLEAAKAKKAEADAKKQPFDQAIARRAQKQVSDNQAEKERVGKAYNEAVKVFKASNPG